MEIKWNAGIAPAQIGQEATTTGINSAANGVSQATPAGISAAKDAFEKTSILGKVSGQSIHGGIAPAAQHLSPPAYLKGIPNIGNHPESMLHLGSTGGMGDPKMMEGISKKLTREKLDSLSNHSESLGFDKQDMTLTDRSKLWDMFKDIKSLLDSLRQVQTATIPNIKP